MIRNFSVPAALIAFLLVQGASAAPAPKGSFEILTPTPGPAPRINGPLIYGCRPGSPFLYRIPATGDRPMAFTASGLPAGLKLDPASGIISGSIAEKGTYAAILQAANPQGAITRKFKIVCGDKLALTPPMGWNDWYSDYGRITDQRIRDAANRMRENGMADAGYQYVNLDDCWAQAGKNLDPGRIGPGRGEDGNLLPNRYFPDMKALTGYIHAKGLKAGIYTSPGPTTCAGFTGSYGHEEQDARQFAAWGFDFLKYDWCSYKLIAPAKGRTLLAMQKPYRLMGELLKRQDRDIVFNLCQYGMGEVWKWGEEVGGQSWRTSGDLGFKLNQFFEVAIANVGHGAWSKPGSWNDPDYIQIGWVGNARQGGPPQPSRLTADEQYAFMSLWSLMAAPLFYSGDLTKLDAFTLNILCNPEVIAVDQDPLGKCAHPAEQSGDCFVLIKELAGGGKAVGLCNRGLTAATVSVAWSDLGVTGSQMVRDLWREKELGTYLGQFSTRVPSRGVVLVGITPRTRASSE